MQARRNALHNLTFHQATPSHAGLWFDRYLEKQLQKGKKVEDGTPYQTLVTETSEIPVPELYHVYFQRWRDEMTLQGAECRQAQAIGRIAVGLGAESVIETAVRLHHTYGVPFIPGSALKGLAANYAHQQLADTEWRKGGEAHKVMFGSPDAAGFITFYDALYVPGSGQPLHPDVITVHHPEYYQEGKSGPADWDDPNPVSFLSATGRYLIALKGDYPIWVNAAFNILEAALRDYGVGAKTSSGYGRMAFGVVTSSPSPQSQTEGAPTGYQRGRVKSFGLGPKRSYGFITPDGGGDDVFVHQSQLPRGVTTLNEGQYVYYRLVRDGKGEHAEDVQLAS